MSSAARFPVDVTDHILEGVLLLDGRRCVAASNRVLEHFFGLEPQVGMPADALLAELGSGAEALGGLRHGERVVIVVNGRLLEVRATAVDDGRELWCCRDCSEELRLHSQIAEQGHMLSGANEAYLVIDANGFVRYVNPYCEQERGHPAGGMVGLRLHAIESYRNPDGSDGQALSEAELVERLRQFKRRGGVHRYDAWHYRRDGSRFPTSVSIRPYRLQDEIVLLLTASDESERLEFVRQLMEARARAEESSRAKSAFLAVTSHELRTPLTAVIGFCELLMLDYAEGHGDLSNYLRLIHRSSTGLLRLINDIIEFAKIEGRSLRFDVRPLDTDGLVDELIERWRLRAEKRGLSLRRQPTSRPVGALVGDAGRINQLLDNLVGNACKFTARGGVTVAIEDAGEQVVFRVSDTGRGISPGARGRIFEPFFQEEDSMTRKSEGTGLGLYICRTLARLLGGEVELEHSSSQGSTFVLRLPRRGPLVDAGGVITRELKPVETQA
jgi:PAS domain S-box-containing protein